MIYKSLGYKRKPVKYGMPDRDFPTEDSIGLEVELEGAEDYNNLRSILNSDVKSWNVEVDDSLKRSGVELIFTEPYCGDRITSALEALDRLFYTSEGRGLEATARTSLHVHVDVRDMNQRQLVNFLLLYILFEKQLYVVGGVSRTGNNNCLPIGHNPSFIEAIAKLQERPLNIGTFRRYADRVGRYVGCNLMSLTKVAGGNVDPMGSIEFRMHEGTKDIVRIRYWITLLIRMKRYAMKKGVSIDTLAGGFSEQGVERFANAVFGDLAEFIIEQPGYKSDVWEGVRNVDFCREYATLRTGILEDLFPDREEAPIGNRDIEEFIQGVLPLRPNPRPWGVDEPGF